MYLTVEDGVRIFYEDHGDGEAVVLIHGAAGSGKSFNELASHLAKDFRVIVVDLRGLSRSDRVPTVSATAWCDDVIAVADAVGLGRFHLIGCSLGARIAAKVALEHKTRVRTLSVDAPLLSATQGASTSLNRRFEDLENASSADLTRWEWFHGEDWKDAVRFYGSARKDETLQEYLTIHSRLSELTLPTLITRGDLDDEVHPLAHAHEWHRAHPDSWMWVAPGTRFSLTQQLPEQFAAVFHRFVSSKKSDQ